MNEQEMHDFWHPQRIPEYNRERILADVRTLLGWTFRESTRAWRSPKGVCYTEEAVHNSVLRIVPDPLMRIDDCVDLMAIARLDLRPQRISGKLYWESGPYASREMYAVTAASPTLAVCLSYLKCHGKIMTDYVTYPPSL